MKQAFLITAYKDYESLYDLVTIFTKTDLCFVHVDKKSKTITDENIKSLNQIEGCVAIREYDIKWGGFQHMNAVIKLMTLALSHEEVEYLHLLTGEDYPLVSIQKLDEIFLGEKKDTIYLSYIAPDALTETVTKRYQYTNYFQDWNMKNKLLWLLQDLTVQLQKFFGKKKHNIGPYGDSQIYKGLIYISQPAKVARYVMQYIAKNKAFWEDLKKCQVPEEFFFQTILMNSPYKDSVVNKELRYMDWTKGDGSSPSYLEMNDWEAVQQAKEDGCLFARKFHPTMSKGLREKIKENW